MRISVKHLAAIVIIVSVLLPALSWAENDVSSVNKSIRIDSGESADDIESVNGSVRIGADAIVRSIESVNGSINLGEGANVEKSIESVNGSIRLSPGSEVGGNVEAVNGRIQLDQSIVAGDIETVNGNISLINGTVVEGNVKVRKPRGWFNKRDKPVKVEIGKDVRVRGDLIFEQPVELTRHSSSSVGEILGDDVTIIKK